MARSRPLTTGVRSAPTTEMYTRCGEWPAAAAARTRFRALTSSPLVEPAQCTIVSTPSTAASMPSPVVTSPVTNSAPSAASRLLRLSTRTLHPASSRRGRTRRPSVPVPPVSRTNDVMSSLQTSFGPGVGLPVTSAVFRGSTEMTPHERNVTVDEGVWLTQRFEEHRTRLRAVAYRMLGSASEADDAVQEAWLRLNRADTSGVENLPAWLTTVVARVCLNMLRSRESRREEPLERRVSDPVVGPEDGGDPEQEAVLADSVGLALLVVLDTLTPAERLAFVLHDMFAVPFDEIGPMIERSPAAARQLASRARRRVKGGEPVPDADLTRQRHVVDAFLAASRGGDFEALVALLHPDVVLHADRAAGPTAEPVLIRGAHAVAKGARLASGRARFTQPALVNGAVGLVMAPRGRLFLVLGFTITAGKITDIDVIADPDRLRQLDLAVLDD